MKARASISPSRKCIPEISALSKEEGCSLGSHDIQNSIVAQRKIRVQVENIRGRFCLIAVHLTLGYSARVSLYLLRLEIAFFYIHLPMKSCKCGAMATIAPITIVVLATS